MLRHRAAYPIISLNKFGIHTSLGHQYGITRGPHFFAYNSLIIKYKGILLKLKSAIAISVEKLIFTIFFDVLLLSYNPSNFARLILPYAAD